MAGQEPACRGPAGNASVANSDWAGAGKAPVNGPCREMKRTGRAINGLQTGAPCRDSAHGEPERALTMLREAAALQGLYLEP